MIDSELAVHLAEIKQGDHVCMVYNNTEEQMAAAIPFIAQGLELDECCAYIASEETVEDVRRHLEEAGIDVETETRRGALNLMTPREAYLRTRPFDPEDMIDFLRRSVDLAVQSGFAGFRVTGEMTWSLGREAGCERLIEYEARLNHFFPNSRALALCQYDKNRFPSSVIHEMLRTHPKLIVCNQVCDNLYYEPPEMVLQERSMAHKVDWMIAQLLRAREAEHKVARFNHELEQCVLQKTCSLEQARSQLQSFCQTMAHDLRAPLRSMRGFADALMEDYGADLDARAHDYTRRICQAASRLEHMIEDLLCYSRMQHAELRLQSVELDLLLEETRNEILADLDRPAEILADGVFPAIVGHRASLKIVLTNLLENAVKFVPKDRTARVRIFMQPCPARDRVRVVVEDNGIGIQSTHLDRVFGMFERLNPESEYPGHGMGLALVRQAIDRMSGKVGVQSTPGAGSRFWFELPLAASAANGARAAIPDDSFLVRPSA